MISYENVTKRYGDVTVIDRLNLTIEAGEFVALIGPSGCGKTTTLKMINRLIPFNEGRLMINGEDIKSVDAVALRRTIGYVIQQIALFPNMTIHDNITVVPRLLGWSAEKREKRSRELLALVGMTYETHGEKYPNELSGGQQQRIGVLRALAADPPIILMDEPFGALDPITRDNLQDDLKTLQEKLQKTIIFVTHDMNEAVKLADRIIFMKEGRVLQDASPEDMLRYPADPMISHFMGKISYQKSGDDLTCGDVMRKRIFTVYESRKTLETVELMKAKEMDTAIVIKTNGTYLGVVPIERLRQAGKPGVPIAQLVETHIPTVSSTTSAKDAFDLLVAEQHRYLVVLNRDQHPVGVVTRASMTNALASLIWGEEDD